MADDKKLHELEIQVTKNAESLKSIHKRTDELSKEVSNISEIAISVKEIAVETREMRKDVNKVDDEIVATKNRIREIEKIPMKRWNGVVEKAISILVAGVVGYMLSNLGF